MRNLENNPYSRLLRSKLEDEELEYINQNKRDYFIYTFKKEENRRLLLDENKQLLLNENNINYINYYLEYLFRNGDLNIEYINSYLKYLYNNNKLDEFFINVFDKNFKYLNSYLEYLYKNNELNIEYINSYLEYLYKNGKLDIEYINYYLEYLYQNNKLDEFFINVFDKNFKYINYYLEYSFKTGDLNIEYINSYLRYLYNNNKLDEFINACDKLEPIMIELYSKNDIKSIAQLGIDIYLKLLLDKNLIDKLINTYIKFNKYSNKKYLYIYLDRLLKANKFSQFIEIFDKVKDIIKQDNHNNSKYFHEYLSYLLKTDQKRFLQEYKEFNSTHNNKHLYDYLKFLSRYSPPTYINLFKEYENIIINNEQKHSKYINRYLYHISKNQKEEFITEFKRLNKYTDNEMQNIFHRYVYNLYQNIKNNHNIQSIQEFIDIFEEYNFNLKNDTYYPIYLNHYINLVTNYKYKCNINKILNQYKNSSRQQFISIFQALKPLVTLNEIAQSDILLNHLNHYLQSIDNATFIEEFKQFEKIINKHNLCNIIARHLLIKSQRENSNFLNIIEKYKETDKKQDIIFNILNNDIKLIKIYIKKLNIYLQSNEFNALNQLEQITKLNIHIHTLLTIYINQKDEKITQDIDKLLEYITTNIINNNAELIIRYTSKLESYIESPLFHDDLDSNQQKILFEVYINHLLYFYHNQSKNKEIQQFIIDKFTKIKKLEDTNLIKKIYEDYKIAHNKSLLSLKDDKQKFIEQFESLYPIFIHNDNFVNIYLECLYNRDKQKFIEQFESLYPKFIKDDKFINIYNNFVNKYLDHTYNRDKQKFIQKFEAFYPKFIKDDKFINICNNFVNKYLECLYNYDKQKFIEQFEVLYPKSINDNKFINIDNRLINKYLECLYNYDKQKFIEQFEVLSITTTPNINNIKKYINTLSAQAAVSYTKDVFRDKFIDIFQQLKETIQKEDNNYYQECLNNYLRLTSKLNNNEENQYEFIDIFHSYKDITYKHLKYINSYVEQFNLYISSPSFNQLDATTKEDEIDLFINALKEKEIKSKVDDLNYDLMKHTIKNVLIILETINKDKFISIFKQYQSKYEIDEIDQKKSNHNINIKEIKSHNLTTNQTTLNELISKETENKNKPHSTYSFIPKLKTFSSYVRSKIK